MKSRGMASSALFGIVEGVRIIVSTLPHEPANQHEYKVKLLSTCKYA